MKVNTWDQHTEEKQLILDFIYLHLNYAVAQVPARHSSVNLCLTECHMLCAVYTADLF